MAECVRAAEWPISTDDEVRSAITPMFNPPTTHGDVTSGIGLGQAGLRVLPSTLESCSRRDPSSERGVTLFRLRPEQRVFEVSNR